MSERDLEAAAKLLADILAKVNAGELTAPGRIAARLEGAATALRAASGADEMDLQDMSTLPSV